MWLVCWMNRQTCQFKVMEIAVFESLLLLNIRDSYETQVPRINGHVLRDLVVVRESRVSKRGLCLAEQKTGKEKLHFPKCSDRGNLRTQEIVKYSEKKFFGAKMRVSHVTCQLLQKYLRSSSQYNIRYALVIRTTVILNFQICYFGALGLVEDWSDDVAAGWLVHQVVRHFDLDRGEFVVNVVLKTVKNNTLH